jgi:hypothetical protein
MGSNPTGNNIVFSYFISTGVRSGIWTNSNTGTKRSTITIYFTYKNAAVRRLHSGWNMNL